MTKNNGSMAENPQSRAVSIVSVGAEDLALCQQRPTKLRSTKSCESDQQNCLEKNDLSTDGSEVVSKSKLRLTRSYEANGDALKHDLPKAVVHPMIHQSESENLGENTLKGSSLNKKLGPPPVFDPYDEAYMANACCECMHYKTGAIFVAVVELFFMVSWVALMVYYQVANVGTPLEPWLIAFQAVVGCLFLAAIVGLLMGVLYEKRCLALPHIFLQVFGIGFALSLTFLTVVVMACGSGVSEAVYGAVFGAENLPKIERAFGPIWPFCLAAIFDFCAAVGIWFYVVVKGFYDFLSDKDLFERLTNNYPETKSLASKILPNFVLNWLEI